MVFVHARNATVRTALQFREIARNRGDITAFLPDQNAAYGGYEKQVIIRQINNKLISKFCLSIKDKTCCMP